MSRMAKKYLNTERNWNFLLAPADVPLETSGQARARKQGEVTPNEGNQKYIPN